MDEKEYEKKLKNFAKDLLTEKLLKETALSQHTVFVEPKGSLSTQKKQASN